MRILKIITKYSSVGVRYIHCVCLCVWVMFLRQSKGKGGKLCTFERVTGQNNNRGTDQKKCGTHQQSDRNFLGTEQAQKLFSKQITFALEANENKMLMLWKTASYQTTNRQISCTERKARDTNHEKPIIPDD